MDPKVLQTVQTMMDEIARGGEAQVRQYCKELDKWEGSILLSAAEIEAKCAKVPEQTKRDIQFAANLAQKSWFKCFQSYLESAVKIFGTCLLGSPSSDLPPRVCVNST